MSLPNTFLCHHSHVELLILTQLHQCDGVFLLTLIIEVGNRDDWAVDITGDDVLAGHLDLLSVRLADSVDLEVHGAFGTHPLAGALLA